jgi:hypothetical protein
VLMNDTSAAYVWQRHSVTGVGSPTISEGTGDANYLLGNLTAASAPADAAGSYRILLPGYAQTTFQQPVRSWGVYRVASGANGTVLYDTAGLYLNKVGITRITFSLGGGNFASGTEVIVYGLPTMA